MEETAEQLQKTVTHLADLIHSGQDEDFVVSFKALHDFEMGQVYSSLPEQMRAVAWRLLDDETLADVFDNLDADDDDIGELLQEMPPQKATEILRNMYADNEAGADQRYFPGGFNLSNT